MVAILDFSNGQSGRFGESLIESNHANFHACITIWNIFSFICSTKIHDLIGKTLIHNNDKIMPIIDLLMEKNSELWN